MKKSIMKRFTAEEEKEYSKKNVYLRVWNLNDLIVNTQHALSGGIKEEDIIAEVQQINLEKHRDSFDIVFLGWFLKNYSKKIFYEDIILNQNAKHKKVPFLIVNKNWFKDTEEIHIYTGSYSIGSFIGPKAEYIKELKKEIIKSTQAKPGIKIIFE